MNFHADSESDLKTSPNHIKNLILSKNRFLWPLRYRKAPGVCEASMLSDGAMSDSWQAAKIVTQEVGATLE